MHLKTQKLRLSIHRLPLAADHQAARCRAGNDRKIAVQIAHDGASAFTDKEVWLEVEYLGTAGFPLATVHVGCGELLIGCSSAASERRGVGWYWATGPNGSIDVAPAAT